MTEHMKVKNKIRKINRKSTFYSILEDSMLNEKEKKMMEMYYIEQKNLDYIADELGYSKAGISKMHERILKKISSLL